MTEGNAGTQKSSGELTIKAANKLDFKRTSQTIELSASDLNSLGEKDLTKIHVKDESGKEVVCQTVDNNGDYYPEQLIFQADFNPGQTRTFTAFAGEKRVYEKSHFRAYGRFVRERCDDFCWENDRIALRIYGKPLETCVLYPLTSSTVDVWSKRTTQLITNDWYMVDNYHGDNGTGGDFYSAGLSRGCGGNGLWAAGKLWVSKNFVESRPLTNGPIRIMFELTYEPFEVNGIMVSEVKRISLDAGHNLTHFQSTYKTEGSFDMICGAGLKKVEGEHVDVNEEYGWLAKWEPMEMNAGEQGMALITDPGLLEKHAEDELNQLMLMRVPSSNIVSHWAGFCWDRSGQFKDYEDWKNYVDQFAKGLLEPIEISVS
jgi:hypothetical protein